MKKLYLIIGIFLILNIDSYGQGETYNWHFGFHSSLTFDTPSLEPLFVPGSAMDTWEGCASISDKDGKLLFYASGNKIWDMNNNIMLNGDGILGNSSATQSCIIIPSPSNSNQYYVFTVDAVESQQNGFRYSIVDMSYNLGLGEVISKNILINSSPIERLTAIQHSDKSSYWIIVHIWQNNEYLAYLLNKDGISSEPVRSYGLNISPRATGSVIKPTLDGKLIASAHSFAKVIEIFDFDNSTGRMALKHNLEHPFFEWPYGVEFSPNNQYLYASLFLPCRLIQLDITKTNAQEILSSLIVLGTNLNQTFFYGSLQLGPNSKIYVAQDGFDYLGVINEPNKSGLECDFVQNGVHLTSTGKSRLGLPTFIQQLVIPDPVCIPKGEELITNGNFDDIRYVFETTLNILDSSEPDSLIKSGTCIINDINPLIINDDCPLFNSGNNYLMIHTNARKHELFSYRVPVEKNENYALNFDLINLEKTFISNISIEINDVVIASNLIHYKGYCKSKSFSFQWNTGSSDTAVIKFIHNNNVSAAYAFDNISFRSCACSKTISLYEELEICYGSQIKFDKIDSKYKCHWTPVNGINDRFAPNPIFNPTQTTVYYVQMNDIETGCSYLDSIKIIVNDVITFEIQAPDFICPGDSIMLNIPEDGFHDFLWNTGEIVNSIMVFKPGTYIVTFRDLQGCSYKAKKNIDLGQVEDVIFESPSEVCLNQQFKLKVKNDASEYIWSDGQNSKEAVFNGPGIYYVSLRFNNGCTVSDSITIRQKEPADLQIYGQANICKGSSTELSIEGNYENILWSNGGEDKTIIIDQPGTYTVTALDKDGCQYNGIIIVELIEEILSELPIDFGEFCIGESLVINKVFDISNIRSTVVQNITTTGNSDVFRITYRDTFPSQLDSGEVLSFTMYLKINKYIPNFYDTILVEINHPCKTTYRIPVTAIIKQSNSKVWVSDTTLEVGNEVCLPIYAQIECDRLVQSNLKYDLNIKLKKSLFKPNIVQHGDMTVTDDEYFYYVHIKSEADVYSKPTIINYLCGLTLLPDSVKNNIDIYSFNWLFTDLPVSTQNSTITLEQCQIGLRQIQLIKVTGFKIQPNTGSGVFEIEVTSSELGLHHIYIQNIAGVRVLESTWIRNSRENSEIITKSFDLNVLPSGVYTVILKTPWSIKTDKLLIIK
ncbi:MAG: hypothetical protein WCZ17_01315 [Candidatus Kapaibacterium sp.]